MANYTIIKTKTQYKEYSKILMELGCKKHSKQNEDEIELLELLIEKWEKDNLKNEDSNPIELLKFLMDNHNMSRNDLIDILEITKGTLSKILSYKKGLSKKVIRKLSETFKVSQEAFNRSYPLKVEENKGHTNEKMMNTHKKMEYA